MRSFCRIYRLPLVFCFKVVLCTIGCTSKLRVECFRTTKRELFIKSQQAFTIEYVTNVEIITNCSSLITFSSREEVVRPITSFLLLFVFRLLFDKTCDIVFTFYSIAYFEQRNQLLLILLTVDECCISSSYILHHFLDLEFLIVYLYMYL